jgi:hypothetical protein
VYILNVEIDQRKANYRDDEIQLIVRKDDSFLKQCLNEIGEVFNGNRSESGKQAYRNAHYIDKALAGYVPVSPLMQFGN